MFITEQEIKLVNIKSELEKAFDAGSAHAIGSFKDFKQIHLDKKEYVKSVIEKLK